MSPKPAAAAALLLLAVLAPAAAQTADETRLRVCSDPDNMPFSNLKEEGFENRIATVLAADLGLPLEYAWDAQYRGFVRRTLRAQECDVIMGLPAEFPGVKTTRPYYRTAYVFVSALDRSPPPASFDDPALRDASIGLQVLGMEGANSPPAAALAVRALAGNVVGFPVWGGPSDPEPQRRMIDAVADGALYVAVAWGPTAGWFGKPHGDRIALTPIFADARSPQMRFTWPIAVATRKSDGRLRDRLQAALDRHRREIRAILDDYGVPAVDARAHRDDG